MPHHRPRTTLAVLAATCLLLAGCTGSDDSPEADPSTPSTPLTAYDTRGVAVARTHFCDRISRPAVKDALGGKPVDATAWDNGETARLTDEVEDVAHEYGCAYRGKGGAEAQAWLFAPPVTGDRAQDLVTAARGADGCAAAPDAPAFGDPSVALECTEDAQATTSFRGLFGDAWLACSVTGSADEGEDRVALAGRWCVQVVEAARVR